MIRKKFSGWEKFIKNFSVTFIGNGKILYYYKNPKNRKITYGKVDFWGNKKRLFLTSATSLILITGLLLYNLHGSPAPARSYDLTRIIEKKTGYENGGNLSLFKLEGDKKTPLKRLENIRDINDKPTLTRLTLLNNRKKNTDSGLESTKNFVKRIPESKKWTNGSYGNFVAESIEKLNLSLQFRKNPQIKDDFSQELRDALSKDNNPANTALSVSDDRYSEIIKDKFNLKKEYLGTSIEDFESITLKRVAMFSSDSVYTPESNQHKVKIHTYRVKRGDSIGALARKFGVSAATIGGSSKSIFNLDEIWVGMKLVIPSMDGILKKIKLGETLAMIANTYKISLDKIIRSNGFEDPDNIPVGRLVFLPNIKPKNLFSGFIWPVRGKINSWYGWRRHPILKRRHLHEGLDIKAKYTRIRAAKSGKVVYSGWMGAYGKVIIIAHPGKFKSLYAHNSRLFVRVGQHVRQGQWIARSGNTGVSTGPHLHFEIWKNNSHTNPIKYLRKRRYY